MDIIREPNPSTVGTDRQDVEKEQCARHVKRKGEVETQGGTLAQKLQSRHMQMIAIGQLRAVEDISSMSLTMNEAVPSVQVFLSAPDRPCTAAVQQAS